MHTYIIPRLHRHRYWGIQALVELTFGLMAYKTSRNHFVNITSHLRLIEMFLQDANGLI